jgi:hypothetical protein
VITALNRCQGRPASDGGMFFTDDLPEVAQPIVARVYQAICPFSPIDRIAYAKQIAAVVVDARRNPKKAYATATL